MTMETKQEPLPNTAVADAGSLNEPHPDVEKDIPPSAEPARKVQGLAVHYTSHL
jgi:hypothetical protein